MKTYAIPALVILGVVATSLAVGSPQSPRQSVDKSTRYSVAVSDGLAIMVDGDLGRTWILERSANRGSLPAWFPLERLDASERDEWRANEKEHAKLSGYQAKLQSMEEMGTVRLHREEAESLKKKIVELEKELTGK